MVRPLLIGLIVALAAYSASSCRNRWNQPGRNGNAPNGFSNSNQGTDGNPGNGGTLPAGNTGNNGRGNNMANAVDSDDDGGIGYLDIILRRKRRSEENHANAKEQLGAKLGLGIGIGAGAKMEDNKFSSKLGIAGGIEKNDKDMSKSISLKDKSKIVAGYEAIEKEATAATKLKKEDKFNVNSVGEGKRNGKNKDEINSKVEEKTKGMLEKTEDSKQAHTSKYSKDMDGGKLSSENHLSLGLELKGGNTIEPKQKGSKKGKVTELDIKDKLGADLKGKSETKGEGKVQSKVEDKTTHVKNVDIDLKGKEEMKGKGKDQSKGEGKTNGKNDKSKDSKHTLKDSKENKKNEGKVESNGESKIEHVKKSIGGAKGKGVEDIKSGTKGDKSTEGKGVVKSEQIVAVVKKDGVQEKKSFENEFKAAIKEEGKNGSKTTKKVGTGAKQSLETEKFFDAASKEKAIKLNKLPRLEGEIKINQNIKMEGNGESKKDNKYPSKTKKESKDSTKLSSGGGFGVGFKTH